MKNRNLTVDEFIPYRAKRTYFYKDTENHASRLRVQGNWLRDAGFNPGDKVKVIVDKDKLTIVNLSTKEPAERSNVEYRHTR